MQNDGPHLFRRGDRILRMSDGAVATVRSASALFAIIETRGFFSERLEIEQGDPDW